MKYLKWLLVVVPLLIQCTTDDGDDNPDSTDVSQQSAELIAEDGTWRVSSYIDSGQNETTDFNGYTFVFSPEGQIEATNSINTLEGTWSIADDDNSSDDSNDDDLEFTIFFPVSENNNFEDLNDDWDIISITASEISLRDVSGGDGSIDTLVFEKM